MSQYNFKVGDRVKFKDTPEHQDYRNDREYPPEFVIVSFDDKLMNDNTVAYDDNVSVCACLFRLDLVESSQPDCVQQAIDTLLKAGYKVTLSKE